MIVSVQDCASVSKWLLSTFPSAAAWEKCYKVASPPIVCFREVDQRYSSLKKTLERLPSHGQSGWGLERMGAACSLTMYRVILDNALAP